MASNSFGNIFRLTSFGESHGSALGGIIDGCPAGLKIDESLVQLDLDRRKPEPSIWKKAHLLLMRTKQVERFRSLGRWKGKRIAL